jgi:hypothetical protein
MNDEAALEALDWLEASRGKPVTASWYIERDAGIEETAPMPAKVEPAAWREGAWLVVYGNGLMRIIDGRNIALAAVVDKRRLVIEYGKRRLVLEASEEG